MKKLAYVAGLFALTCAPLLAALYEGLEVGMDKDQVLKTLRRSKQLGRSAHGCPPRTHRTQRRV